MSKDRLLLPKDVKPSSYKLTITLDLQNCTFQGVVDIELDVLSVTKKLVFHAHEELLLLEAKVYFGVGHS
jgi:aminopeptidase N